jgi:hypothetical protein
MVNSSCPFAFQQQQPGHKIFQNIFNSVKFFTLVSGKPVTLAYCKICNYDCADLLVHVSVVLPNNLFNLLYSICTVCTSTYFFPESESGRGG